MALVAHYKLNGNGLDSSKNTNLTEISNVTWADGKSPNNKSAQFAGNTSSFVANNMIYSTGNFLNGVPPSSTNNFNGDATFSAWVYPISLDSTNRMIFCDNNFNEGMLYFRNDRIVADWSGGVVVTYLTTVNIGEWYHVCMTHQRDWENDIYILKLYINGELVGTHDSLTASTTSSWYGPDNRLVMGYNFNGKIENVIIQEGVISEDRIQRLAGRNRQMIGHWPLVGNADDVSGFGNHGVVIGSPLDNQLGLFSNTYEFTDNSQYITIPHTEKLSKDVFGTSEYFTLAGWVYPKAYENWACIINKAFGGSWSNTTAGLWVSSSNGITAAMGANVSGNPSGSSRIVSWTPPSTDRWYHVAGVADGTNLHLYVDGIHRGSITVSMTHERSENTQPITIGRRSTGSNPTLKGMIQDVRVYNYPLTEQEIKRIAQPKVLHYKFDDRAEEATENLIDPKIYTWSASGSPLREIYQKNEYAAIVSNRNRSESLDWWRAESANITEFEIGDTITISFDYISHIGRVGVGLRQYRTDGSSGRANTTFLGDIEYSQGRYSNSWVATEDCNYFRVWIYVYNRDYNFPYEQEITIRNLQVEVKSKDTPFTASTREGQIVKDHSLSQNHGTVGLTTTPKWVSGEISYGAMEFFREDPYLYIDSNIGTIENYPFTISAWVKAKTTSNWQMAVSLVESSTRYWCIGTQSGDWAISFRPDQINIRSNTNVDTNWHLLTGVFTETSTKLFLDGVELFDDNRTADISSPPTAITIGRQRQVSTDFGHGPVAWDGFIDDVRIYAKALSDSEIQQIYNERSKQMKFNNDTTSKITFDPNAGQLKIG